MNKQLLHRIVSQFMHPRGLAGRLVGWEMALRPSNRKRNTWAVSLLDVQPSDRVLEIGFGPGIAIRELARLTPRGQVVGINRSAVMPAQTARRNAPAIRTGRVSPTVGSVDDLPAFGGPFDKNLAVNNLGMWSEPALRLKELGGLLGRGGLIAIVSQPRCPGATAETTEAAANEIVELLEAAGFVAIRVETLDLKPPVACVIGAAPSASERTTTPGQPNRRGVGRDVGYGIPSHCDVPTPYERPARRSVRTAARVPRARRQLGLASGRRCPQLARVIATSVHTITLVGSALCASRTRSIATSQLWQPVAARRAPTPTVMSPPVTSSVQRAHRFLAAVHDGDLQTLDQLLAHDVVLHGDGGRGAGENPRHTRSSKGGPHAAVPDARRRAV